MAVKVYKKILNGKYVKSFLDIPENMVNEELELTIRPRNNIIFNSISVISLDTKNFKFNRNFANER